MALTEIGARLSLKNSSRFKKDADKAADGLGRIGKEAGQANRKVSALERSAARAGTVIGRGLGRASVGAARGVGRLGSVLGVGLVGGVAAAGLAVPLLGKSLLDTATQMEGLEQKARVVFGDALPQVSKWAKDSAAKMGLSASQATGLAAGLGDLLVPIGFTRKAAAKMSTDVVGLSGALAQWSGGQYDATAVAGILQGAMLGETDALQGLGIAISAADVEAALLAKGQDKLAGNARKQAEAQAIVGLVYEKSTDAQKAYKDGGAKLAAVQARLRGSFQSMREKMAAAAAPHLLRWMTSLEQNLPRIQRALGDFAQGALPGIREGFREFGESMGRVADKARGVIDMDGKAKGTGTVIGDLVGGLIKFAGKAAEIWVEVQAGLAAFVKASMVMIGDALTGFGDMLLDVAKWSPVYRDQLKAAGEGFQSAGRGVDALSLAVDDLMKPRSMQITTGFTATSGAGGVWGGGATAPSGPSGDDRRGTNRGGATPPKTVPTPRVPPRPPTGPTRKPTAGLAVAGGSARPLVVQVQMDRRTIGTAVIEDFEDRGARR